MVELPSLEKNKPDKQKQELVFKTMVKLGS